MAEVAAAHPLFHVKNCKSTFVGPLDNLWLNLQLLTAAKARLLKKEAPLLEFPPCSDMSPQPSPKLAMTYSAQT